MNRKRPEPIRVMLVEDNPDFRKVIGIALAKAPDIELVSEFGTAEIALRSLQDIQDADRPQLVLLDLRLPGMSGIDALPEFKTRLPEARVIILTQSDTEADVLQAVYRGANGYLLKNSSIKDICEAIRLTMEGGAPVDAGVTGHILASLRPSPHPSSEEGILTEREIEILALVGAGLVKKEIADKLGIHYKTVDAHVARIYKKLDVTNAPSAITKGYELGILS